MGKKTKLDEYIEKLKQDIADARKDQEANAKFIEGLEYGLEMAELTREIKNGAAYENEIDKKAGHGS